MKKITAYINTTRVHWLVEELQAMGIGEIMVTEHFKPLSQVSRLELLCQDAEMKRVKDIIHRVGTTGASPPDHDIIVSEHEPERLRLLPMSVRLNPLEESRLKQFINNAFRGVGKRLLFTFSVTAFSIVCVALILHVRIEGVQYAAREANRNARVITDATKQIETAHLEQLLAAERLHRGNMTSSLLRKESRRVESSTFGQQFKNAGAKHAEAALVLKQSHLFEPSAVDSLVALESQFQSMISSMFAIITSLDSVGKKNNSAGMTQLSQSHDNIMAMLDALHLHSTEMLASLEHTVNNLAMRRENESEDALRAVRLSLTILTLLAFLTTIAMWLVARQKVSHPLQVLVKEAKTLDTEGLK